MTDERWTAVDDYVEGLLVPEERSLGFVTESSLAAGLPPIQVSPPLGKLLNVLATAVRAKRVLEIGTLGGYSGIWLARGLPSDGRLVTLELDPAHAAVATANFERAGLGDRVDVRVGPALETLAALVAEGAPPFDLVFIDADKESYPEYLDWSMRLSRPGTLIVADNVVRDGKVAREGSGDSRVEGARRFLQLLADDRRLEATVIQTVGVKGYDGFGIAVVTGAIARHERQ